MFPSASVVANEETSYIDLGVQVICPNSRGAGFYMESKVVVTAKHVVEDCLFPRIQNNRGDYTGTIRIRTSESKDIAYLEVRESISPIVTILNPPKLGSEVITVGSPIEGLLLSKGVLKEVFRDLSDEWLVLDIPADHGSSGGPVFASGGLIGLVISKDKRNGDIYAYKGSDLKEDFRYVNQADKSGQNYERPVGKSGAEILMPIFISATITFLLGVGVGSLLSRGRKQKPKPRIRIEV